jgi:hypothetical protein
MLMLISAGKNQAMRAVETDVVRGVDDSGAQRVASSRRSDRWVEVELSRVPSGMEFRRLGSLTERYGMRMDVQPTLSGQARASISVPRANSQREAEATVASLFDWIRLREPR